MDNNTLTIELGKLYDDYKEKIPNGASKDLWVGLELGEAAKSMGVWDNAKAQTFYDNLKQELEDRPMPADLHIS
jgi:hypothetical protein